MQSVRPNPRVLAPYATDPGASRGRRIAEPASSTRTPFQRDRDRIVHSSAFRRLTHKTQVFITTDGDHYRSRLTHSLEVAQIARSIARVLALDEDLAEALALAHDFGHTPFGHEGERILSRLMEAHGGFDHNVQAYRIVTRLERRYAGVRRAQPHLRDAGGAGETQRPSGGRRCLAPSLPPPNSPTSTSRAMRGWRRRSRHSPTTSPTTPTTLTTGFAPASCRSEALASLPLVADILRRVDREAGTLDPARRTHELVRRLLTRMIEDVIGETVRRIARSGISSADDVAAAGRALVAVSEAMAAEERRLKAFLHEHLYADAGVLAARQKAGRVVEELFGTFASDPSLLPAAWRWDGDEETRRLRRTCDYIAGMTDRFALREHARLVGGTPQLW